MDRMIKQITIEDLMDTLAIKKNEVVFVSSDITQLAWLFHENDAEFSPDILIESMQKRLGADGTLIFPTYNWDFCHDTAFDYKKRVAKPALSALQRLNAVILNEPSTHFIHLLFGVKIKIYSMGLIIKAPLATTPLSHICIKTMLKIFCSG